MAAATAQLKNYRQSPRKVRLIADLVRGKTAEHALALLNVLPKRGSEPMRKLITSAVANAKLPANEVYISEIQVNGGIVFKRHMPRARGRASAIRKKSSIVTLSLDQRAATKKAPKAKKSKAAAEAETK